MTLALMGLCLVLGLLGGYLLGDADARERLNIARRRREASGEQTLCDH